MPCLLLKKVSSTIKEVILYSFKWTQYSYEKSCERCKMENSFFQQQNRQRFLLERVSEPIIAIWKGFGGIHLGPSKILFQKIFFLKCSKNDGYWNGRTLT